MKLLPRQHVSALELVLFIDLVPGFGRWEVSLHVEDEFMKQADEWTAEMTNPSHSFQPCSFLLS